MKDAKRRLPWPVAEAKLIELENTSLTH